MGRATFAREAYDRSYREYVPPTGPSTRAAEQKAYNTGKLDPLVDPAEYGVIRRSLLRMEELTDGPNAGLFELTDGTSMPVETRLDTTGSMGGNVDIALSVLPDLYQKCSGVLPGYHLHIATGIFGDCVDKFVLCRPQFEMVAEKIVRQLTLMAPQRGGGGNNGEDPHYGIFGGAYLVAAYINRIGLKGYDFTVTDEPAREMLSERELKRIFGNEVFDKTKLNGFDIDPNDLPSTKEVVDDLQKRAFGFVLTVGDRYGANRFWTQMYGHDHVVQLPDIRLLPYVQAVIIGLTEGTLSLDQVEDFLAEAQVGQWEVREIVRSVSNIPLAIQPALPNYERRPQKGDLFRSKTDLWPIGHSEESAELAATEPEPVAGPNWL